MAVDGTDARLKCTPDTNDSTCVPLILEALRNVLTSSCAASEAYEELTTGTAGHKWANGADQVTQEGRHNAAPQECDLRGAREASRKQRQLIHHAGERVRRTVPTMAPKVGHHPTKRAADTRQVLSVFNTTYMHAPAQDDGLHTDLAQNNHSHRRPPAGDARAVVKHASDVSTPDGDTRNRDWLRSQRLHLL